MEKMMSFTFTQAVSPAFSAFSLPPNNIQKAHVYGIKNSKNKKPNLMVSSTTWPSSEMNGPRDWKARHEFKIRSQIKTKEKAKRRMWYFLRSSRSVTTAATRVITIKKTAKWMAQSMMTHPSLKYWPDFPRRSRSSSPSR